MLKTAHTLLFPIQNQNDHYVLAVYERCSGVCGIIIMFVPINFAKFALTNLYALLIISDLETLVAWRHEIQARRTKL